MQTKHLLFKIKTNAFTKQKSQQTKIADNNKNKRFAYNKAITVLFFH